MARLPVRDRVFYVSNDAGDEKTNIYGTVYV